MDSSAPPPAPEGEEERRNWLELPREVTASILARLVAIDVLTSAQFVCKSWLEISHDPLVWRRIDMYKSGDLDLEMDLIKMCRIAVDRSAGQLLDINIEYFGNDDLLDYIANRSSRLKRLRLACCYSLSEDRMINVISKLPLLEELDLTLCPFSPELLKALGRACPRLATFKLNSQAYRILSIDPDEEAVYNAEVFAIAANMPELRHLQLIGNTVTDSGLAAILDGCPCLESLDLRRCLNLSLRGDVWKRCVGAVRLLRLPRDPTDDYDFITGQDDGSDFGSWDACHHWFSGNDDDDDDDEYLQLVDDYELDNSPGGSDGSSEGDSFDYEDFI